METLSDFMSDCVAISGGRVMATPPRSHGGLTRVLENTIPVSQNFAPKTSFGERVINDANSGFTFDYSGTNLCKDSEVTLLNSLATVELAVDQPVDHADTVRGIPIIIFTLNGVAQAIQKNTKIRTSYALRSAPKFNLISHTIATFSAPGFYCPPCRPGTIVEVPLEKSDGHFWYGRYATSAVAPEVRTSVIADESRQHGLLLDHDSVTTRVDRLLGNASSLANVLRAA